MWRRSTNKVNGRDDQSSGGGFVQNDESEHANGTETGNQPVHVHKHEHKQEHKSDDMYGGGGAGVGFSDADADSYYEGAYSSDDDSDYLFTRQRSRSFSDAQEFLSGNGQNQPPHFSAASGQPTPPIFSPVRNGLHHRSKVVRSHADDTSHTMDDEETPSPLKASLHYFKSHMSPNFMGSDSKNPTRWHNRSRPQHHRQPPYRQASNRRTHKRWSYVNAIRLSIAVILAIYVTVLIRQSMMLTRETKAMEEAQAVDSPFRQYASADIRAKRKEAFGIQHDRSQGRKHTSRPDPTMPAAPQWYTVSRDGADHSQTDAHANAAADFVPGMLLDDTPAALENLCGTVARGAATANPGSYPDRLALNSQSKVVITGIVSNPVAFSLALTLATKCDVVQIMGVDQMFPNSVQHRLAMQERIEILMSQIPKMAKPIILPFIGLDPITKKPSSSQIPLEETGEWNFLANFEPTHVVHFASADLPIQLRQDWINTLSPYVDETHNPQIFHIRNSAVAMEQLLAYMANLSDASSRPQLVYSSTTPLAEDDNHAHAQDHSGSEESCRVHAETKAFDEILAATYHKQIGMSSIAMRIPQHSVYGHWGRPDSLLFNEIENALDKFYGVSPRPTYVQPPKQNMAIGDGHNADDSNIELLHVDDVVNAVIATMQFRAEGAITTDMSTRAYKQSLSTVRNVVHKIVDPEAKDASNFLTVMKQKVHQFPVKTDVADPLNGWTPKLSLFDGLLKTIAWHVDRRSPFGSPKPRPSQFEVPQLDPKSGDALLKRHGHPTCDNEDVSCHMSRDFLPCISECNMRDQCLSSVFDNVREMLWSVTEGCKTVLYTHSLEEDTDQLPLHAEFMDEAKAQAEGKPLICNFAFIPKESKLAQTSMNRFLEDKPDEFTKEENENDDAFKNRLLNELNGRLLYRGWILILVDDGMGDLSVPDKSLLKLSPGRLFHSDVDYAFFVEDNFSTSPKIDDVQFLIGEMRRDSFPKRTVEKKDIITDPETGLEKIQRAKYRVPGEPKRRASILFAPLRHPETFVVDPTKKLSVHDATKFMRYEIDMDPDEKEPSDIRRQREFYERIPSFINSGALRSTTEPWYRYSMHHWVRTRWVVHDLSLEEARQLRCEWYQEHVQWETDIDQLSFAHAMAKMEVERRIAHEEPDDHIRTFIDEHPELRDLTDAYEWHPMQTEDNRLYHEPMLWTSQLPDHIDKATWERNHGRLEELRQSKMLPSTEPLFVRIMSERMMALSRRAWMKIQKRVAKRKRTNNKKRGH